ncbi:MAG: hypothetical protein KO173_03495 [Methanoregulaceae archaeon]|nr:hypothetical protein [Methanoregulaceae archaeon]HOP67685.1 hypothetical protein [Methanoregulaceae archaeon]
MITFPELSMQRTDERQRDGCPVFGVRSKAIPIGLGLLLVIFAVVPLLTPGIPAPPLPVIAILMVSGAAFVWMGVLKVTSSL